MRIVEILKVITLSVVASWATACSVNEGFIIAEQGRFTLNINTVPTFTYADGTVYAPEHIAVPSVDDYSLTLSGEGREHTWPSVADRNKLETYAAGTYEMKLRSNGEPSFGTTQSFDIQPSEIAIVDALCTPLQSLLRTKTVVENSPYAVEEILYQSGTSQFNSLQINANNYITPGIERILVILSNDAGQRRIINSGCEITTSAAEVMDFDVTLTGNTLRAGRSERTITDAIFTSQPPQITTHGFTSGETVNATEGITLTTPLTMQISSATELCHIWINTDSPFIALYDAEARIDLMHLTERQQQMLTDAGMKYSINASSTDGFIDFTTVIEQIATISSALSTFTVIAEDICGVCSDPQVLSVNTDIINFTLLSTTPAPLGIDRASITIASGTANIERADFSIETDGGVQCEITDWQPANNGVKITFEVPSGDKDVNISVNYMGLARLHTVIGRSAPQTTITVDAFATSATFILQCETTECTAAMTRYAEPYIDGQRASIDSRNIEEGIIEINGLTPGKTYTATLYAPATVQAATAKFTTETARQLPDPSFEDWRDLISYKQLPRGGRYSATTVALFNRQNYSDIDVKWVKSGWASVNAKTFDTTSKRHNTWYMQPSTTLVWEPQDGYKAMCLTSVAWDHDGAAIPDYVQLPGQNLMYNPNVPKVAHRSAGRLFLGEYKYDAATGAEAHVEGIAFTSRPSSLNGFYKYLPDLGNNTDKGLAVVTLLGIDTEGNEIAIATGKLSLATSPDYKAFNIPLTYNHSGIKATRICVLFASSENIGNQELEDARVSVTPSLENSSMTGSRLWIDNLSLSY